MCKEKMRKLVLVCMCIVFQTSKALPAKKMVVEGDILVTKNVAEFMVGSGRKRKAMKGDIMQWEGGIIPYSISSDIEPQVRQIIDNSFKVYELKTCLKFVPAKTTDNDYIHFIKDKGCYSAIGRQGGEQVISIGDGCQTQMHVLHELMHGIGFFHEQSRFDRELYVNILWWNIADDAFKNFASYDHGKLDTLGAPYDKHSILHYNNKAFSKYGDNTIESIDNPEEELGGESLSDIDIQQINKLYNCNL
ncbi:zinc metalloproteinase nas-13 isoform X3 [Hydra vulgaris]|uniref:Metalloendopeptidase n=2 Tax=Hydra vulgaris TaxID=6087 RepID=A0ABM4CIM5_HYDVU